MSDVKLKESVDQLLARDDVWMTRERVEEYLSSGKWNSKSFVDFLEQNAAQYPENPALIDDDGRITSYREYNEQTAQLALGLLELGIQPHDRVAIQLPNSSEFMISLMGAAKAKILPVLCHLPYTEYDLEYIFELTEAKAIIIPDQFKNKNHLEIARKIKDKYPSLEHIIVVSETKHDGTISFTDLLSKEKTVGLSKLEELSPMGTDPFFLMFTSGTTGRPKAELHLHTNNLYWINSFNEVQQYPADAKWLVVTPIAHLTGLGIGCLGALYRGAPVALLSAWDVSRAVEMIEREQPTYILGAPPMLIDLARFEGLENRNVQCVNLIAYAGAPCPTEILSTLNRRLGCEITAFYGYTEGGATHCTRPGDSIEITSTSFGKIVPGMNEKIIDENGNVLTAPCEGEMLVSGPNMIPGYFRQPHNTKKIFDNEGYYHSADIVKEDENGYCTFVSRRDDLINRGGYKIDPREIEEVLYTHPDIAQAAVVAMSDERLGQRAAAFIVPKQPGAQMTLDEITNYLNEKGVNKQHWPEAVKMVDSFPMTSTGKFQRYALRAQAMEMKPQR